MEMMVSKRDVIVCRGIWYVLTLLSLFGLSISLNLLWPPGDSSLLSPFLRDGAVSATTFYAVTLLRYLFFTDPPSTCYKEFTTPDERLPQAAFSEIAMSLVITSPIYYSVLFKTNNNLFSLFCISLFTGGIGLIQLSDKFRMETRHAFLTLFIGWLFGLLATFEALYCNDHHGQAWCIGIALLYESLSLGLFFYNFPDVLSTSRLILLKALPFKKEKLVLSTLLI